MAARKEISGPNTPQPPQVDLDTIGKRLRWAIEQRPPQGRKRGVRLFQSDMESRMKELETQKKKLRFRI